MKKRCSVCNVKVVDFLKEALGDSQFGLFYNSVQTKWDDGKIYCSNCKPHIMFYFKVGKPFSRTIEIPIPKKKEYKLKWSYFYDQVVKILSLDVDKILINGEKRAKANCFLCPAEYFKLEHRTYKVTIL